MVDKRGLILALILGIFLIEGVYAVANTVTINYPTNTYYAEKINYINWSYTVTNVFNCWYTLDKGATNVTMALCSSPQDTITPSIEGDNTWIVYVNRTNGNIYSASVNFWVDSISPIVEATTPAGGNGYTNGNLLSLIANLVETNKGGYNGAGVADGSIKYVYRKFYYPEFSGSEEGSYNINGDNNADCSLTPSVLNDGDYTYNIKVRDKYPNGTTIREVTTSGIITRDTINPIISITSPGDASPQVGEVSITAEAEDDRTGIAQIQIQVYDSEDNLVDSSTCTNVNECNWNWDSSDVEDGTYYIVGIAQDKAGNSKTSEQISIEADNTNPRIDFIIPTPINNSVLNSIQIIKITASDFHLSLIKIYVDGEIVATTTETTKLSYELSEGNHSIYAVAEDSFGNLNSTEIRRILIDLTPPVLSITSPDASSWKKNDFSVSRSDSDPGAGLDTCQIRIIDAGAGLDTGFVEMNCNEDYLVSVGLIEGKKCVTQGADSCEVQIRTNDSAGNINTATRKFSIDFGSPTTTNNAPEGWEKNNVTISLTPSDLLSGIQNTKYCIDSSNECNPTTSGTEVTISSEGINHLRYYSTDNAGNSEEINSVQVKIDKTGPVITLDSPEDNSVLDSEENNVEFSWNAEDEFRNGDSCNLKLNNELYEGSKGELGYTYTAEELEAGRYNWTIICEDELGNSAESETRFFTILSEIAFSDTNTEFTNLSSVDDITNVTYFFVLNLNGSVNWTKSIDFSSGVDWGKCMNISYNKIIVDSACFAGFNGTAKITLYNLTWASPQILKDGEVCSSCTLNSYDAFSGTLIFSVTGFSVYTTQETPVTTTTSSGSGGGGSRRTIITSEPVANDNIASLNTPNTETDTGIELTNETPTETEESQGFFSTLTGAITGAIVGTPTRKAITYTCAFLLCLVGIFFGAKYALKAKKTE